MKRGESFLAVVPTNKIAQETIIKDVKRYCKKHNMRIIQVSANKMCLLNQQKCEECPELDKLPFLPLPRKCDECSLFSTCPVTRIISIEEFDGIVITYDKLVSLILASIIAGNATAKTIIDKLVSVENIIFDEVHTIQYGKTKSLGLYAILETEPVSMIDFQKYECLESKFDHLQKLVTNFNELFSDPLFNYKIRMLLGVVSRSLDSITQIDLSEEHKSILCKNISRSNREFFAAYSQIIPLVKNYNEYGLHIRDVLKLEEMLSIVYSANLVLKRHDSGLCSTINLVAVKHIHKLMLKEFCSIVKGKRLIMTSATICCFDYSFLFDEGASIKQFTFGPCGDPMNTNSKMLILADTKKYHAAGNRSISKNMFEIVSNINQILDYWGDDNCLIITVNTRVAREIQEALKKTGRKKEVMYYNSSDSIGVSSDARVMIAVGFAYKPSDAYDLVTSTKEKSDILREESVHCDTWQALSRVKDPDGKQPSVVFALGCTEMDCRNVITWGTDRNISIIPGLYGQKKVVEVTTTNNVSQPTVLKCKSFQSMLFEAAIHTQNKKVVSDLVLNPLFNIYYSGFKFIACTINNKSELLSCILQPLHSGNDDDLIQRHLNGEQIIKTRTLSGINKVKWICFVIPDTNATDGNNSVPRGVDRLCKFLTVCSIPFLLECCNNPNSYRFWIFIESIRSNVAKIFGKWILKQSGVKCQMYPKQSITNRKGSGDLVILPFAVDQNNGVSSKIWIGNSFQDFKKLDIGIVDLSVFDEFSSNPPGLTVRFSDIAFKIRISE